ncbi:hypothetical protein GSP01_01310 [Gluconobacter sphaericus NBRC 12467]|nr:hypothetical protein GSP01_01310 [Gluconobacter sphaericus NBRC 12467]
MARCPLRISRPAVLLMEIKNEADVLARRMRRGLYSDGGSMRFPGKGKCAVCSGSGTLARVGFGPAGNAAA